jgi:hypothetical protein
MCFNLWTFFYTTERIHFLINLLFLIKRFLVRYFYDEKCELWIIKYHD